VSESSSDIVEGGQVSVEGLKLSMWSVDGMRVGGRTRALVNSEASTGLESMSEYSVGSCQHFYCSSWGCRRDDVKVVKRGKCIRSYSTPTLGVTLPILKQAYIKKKTIATMSTCTIVAA